MSRERVIAAAGAALAETLRTIEQMTAREQAEAAWHPGGRYTVDELEDRIRARRGLPPITRAA